MKKFLASLLPLCLLLSIFPVIASASGNGYAAADGSKIQYFDLCKAVKAAKIVDANDTAFISDYEWYDIDAGEYIISSPEELVGFANIVNGTAGDVIGQNNFKNKVIKLGADIDLKDIDGWTPIGALDAGFSFAGEFDGKGKTISNLTITNQGGGRKARIGLFASLEGANVHDLTLDGVNITISGSNIRAGALTGSIRGQTYVKNVAVKNMIVNAEGAVRVNSLCNLLNASMINNADVDVITIIHSGEEIISLCGLDGISDDSFARWKKDPPYNAVMFGVSRFRTLGRRGC